MATVTKTIALNRETEDTIIRFDIHQIIQHAGLAVTFILLVLLIVFYQLRLLLFRYHLFLSVLSPN